jgi:hypothetical protein
MDFLELGMHYRRAEYDGLVRHLIDRAANRRALTAGTLAAVGVVAGYALHDDKVITLLLVPILLFFGQIAIWEETDEIVRIQLYIRTKIEPPANGAMAWESLLHKSVRGYRIQPASYMGLMYFVLSFATWGFLAFSDWQPQTGSLPVWQASFRPIGRWIAFVLSFAILWVWIRKAPQYRIKKRIKV